MTTQNKHTLLPWKHELGTPFIIRDSGLIIADFFNDKCPLPENPFGVGEANAAFAALACNSHYELVERVASLEQILNWCQRAFETGDAKKAEEALYAIRRYSLARATGQEVA